MSSPKRGRALIVSNVKFGTQKERKGSEVDEKNLSTLLSQLSFECVNRKDLCAKVIFLHFLQSLFCNNFLLIDLPKCSFPFTNLANVISQNWFTKQSQPWLVFQDLKLDIKEETQHPDHEHYGMFILAIMTHGTAKNEVYGSDDKIVNLTEVCDLLSSTKFPVMAGKPKLVIIQACSGGGCIV